MQNLIVSASKRPCIDETEFEIVERKGVGHPDTLCDTIAEKISRAYSQYCQRQYGVILRHMVDKIALSGGTTKVTFGGGKMLKPVKLFLNCRFTRTYENRPVPYVSIVREVVEAHLAETIPLFARKRWLRIIDNTHFSPGPGVVYEADGTSRNDRRFFFDVPTEEFAIFHDNGLRANDTSTTVSYSPLSSTERVVLFVERTLNSPGFKLNHPYVGTDIKVMARRQRDRVALTLCVPFIASQTRDARDYERKLKLLKAAVNELTSAQFKRYRFSLFLNTRDDPTRSDYYLTLTGSAIESGDEGVVGRGNRANGVIPFTRHMSMEACCGKNPVYHVGKIYTAIGSLISQEIYEKLGLETYVYLTSQMGRHLSDPWAVLIEVSSRRISRADRMHIAEIADRHLADTRPTTRMIIDGELLLY